MMESKDPKDSRNTISERTEMQRLLERSNENDLESAEQQNHSLTEEMVRSNKI